MKTFISLLGLLLFPQILSSAIITGTYSSQSFSSDPSQYAYGSFQYDSSLAPASYDSIGNAFYYPTSSHFAVYYPPNNYSFLGSIESLEIGDDIVGSINFGLPYDYFRIWARNGTGQTTIFLIDSTASAFHSDALPASLFLDSFNFGYFEISGDVYRQGPLESISVVPEAGAFPLLTFGVVLSLLFLKRKILTGACT